MTTQLETQTNKRTNTDDRAAETHNPAPQTTSASQGTVSGEPRHAVHDVIEFSMETARRLADVSAQIETRGYKLLLKAMAERHARYARELAAYTHDPDVDVPSAAMMVDEVQLGLSTMQTSMTLPREGRQDLVIGELVAEERALLEKYDKAIAVHPPAPVDKVLTTQKQRLTAAYDNMRRVADGRCELVARVYSNQEDGERAITSLRAQGIEESDIDVLEGEQMQSRVAGAPQTPKTRPTVLSGAAAGGVVGLLIGVAWWLLLRAGADAADVTVVEPMTVGPVILITSSLIFGALMGAVFGWFIGRNKAEDDAFLTQQSLQEGDLLVAVYVGEDRMDQVEQTLHVHHGRELPA